jgi:hypothetical protein
MNFLNYDPTCQLKEVGCVISEDNIYCNIQKNSDPCLIDFDIENPKNWRKFFKSKSDKKKFFPQGSIETIQPPLRYVSSTQSH